MKISRDYDRRSLW